MRNSILSVLWLVALPAALSAQALDVRHDHDPWGGCEGELTISEEGIRYEADDPDHSRSWNWVDIQGFDRKSATEFTVLTYEDLLWHAGLDRNFDFTTLPETDGLSDSDFMTIEAALARPATDRVPRVLEAEYEIPVKHLHVLGGCEGVLRFGPDWIVYDTDHAEDARSWRRDRHVASVWSSNEFELELRIVEENQRAFDKTTRFTFQLKEPLDRVYYERLRREYLLAR